MGMAIKVDIVSQEKEIFSGLVNMLIVSGSMGEMGIDHGHAPLLTTLKPGRVKLRMPNGETEYYYISGGMLEVQPSCATVLADVAEHVGDLDEQAALDAKKKAQALLKEGHPDQDQAALQAELSKAVAQIKVIQELGNKDA